MTAYFLPEIITHIFQYISFQQVQQASRVSKTFRIASDVYTRECIEKSSRIQKCFRQWRNRRTFLANIEKDLPLWNMFFSTTAGKRYGKALFNAYFRKFIISSKPSQEYWRDICGRLECLLSVWVDHLILTEEQVLEKFSQNQDATQEDVIKLINKVLIPYMDKNGYGILRFIQLIFCGSAPAIWENYRPITLW